MYFFLLFFIVWWNGFRLFSFVAANRHSYIVLYCLGLRIIDNYKKKFFFINYYHRIQSCFNHFTGISNTCPLCSMCDLFLSWMLFKSMGYHAIDIFYTKKFQTANFDSKMNCFKQKQFYSLHWQNEAITYKTEKSIK